MAIGPSHASDGVVRALNGMALDAVLVGVVGRRAALTWQDLIGDSSGGGDADKPVLAEVPAGDHRSGDRAGVAGGGRGHRRAHRLRPDGAIARAAGGDQTRSRRPCRRAATGRWRGRRCPRRAAAPEDEEDDDGLARARPPAC